MTLKDLNINNNWTLFLDRDGVINKKLDNDYVKHWIEFEFIEGVFEALKKANSIFGKIVIVTNQQGIGKGLMTERNLEEVHAYMCAKIEAHGGKIERCYHAPELDGAQNKMRKPQPGMALKAKDHYPEIQFDRSVMVGDSDSDIVFGQQLGMKTVRVRTAEPIGIEADDTVVSLSEFLKSLKNEK